MIMVFIKKLIEKSDDSRGSYYPDKNVCDLRILLQKNVSLNNGSNDSNSVVKSLF